MRGKYQIIARYTDGVAKFWIGRKLDTGQPLTGENVEWMSEGKQALAFDRYADAEKRLRGNTAR